MLAIFCIVYQDFIIYVAMNEKENILRTYARAM